MRCPFVIAVAILLAACGDDPLTELIVAVDTDLAVPEQIDALRIDVVGPGGELRRSMGPLDGTGRLPATLGVVHRGGPLDPVVVTATASLGGRDVVQSTARVAFVQDEARVLRLFLAQVCVGKLCAADETCDRGGCRPERYGPEELLPWTGGVGRIDGGPEVDAGSDAGADACVPMQELCNEMDDDCDEAVDEDFDLEDDPDNCGTCGTACTVDPPHAAGVCVEGDCRLLCDDDFDDCDEDEVTGCEAFLATPNNCGSCAITCDGATPLCSTSVASFECVSSCTGDLEECSSSCVDTQVSPRHCGACDNDCVDPPHATGVCVGGSCDFVCDADWGDCAGDAGCETRLRSIADCGGCGVACQAADATTSCSTGSCLVVGCLGSHGDCDGTVANGCEVDLAADPSNCGLCGTACLTNPANAVSICTASGCDVDCDPGFEDCNGVPDDGCETNLADPATCGSCGIRCTAGAPVCAGDAISGFFCTEACDSPRMLCGGSCVDPETDALHCDGCNMPCPVRANANRSCVAGSCGYSCLPGYADCDGMEGNGCETALGTVTDCTSCGDVCTFDNATAACGGGGCELAMCDSGYDDCDIDAMNGCETDLTSDPSSCNACGMICPTPTGSIPNCESSDCGFSCMPDLGNCDSDDLNGCETDTTSATAHCGACGFDCEALDGVESATCGSSLCILTCTAGATDCDDDVSNGCECTGTCISGVCS